MDENESIDYAELFGIDTSENTAEVAEPSNDENEAGAQEQEAADPAEEIDAAEESGTGEEDGTDDQGNKQSQADNAAFAAARRKAEQQRDTAIAQAKADSQKEMDDFVAAMGLTNPYTGQAIKTKAEYDVYQKLHADKQREQFMQVNGMTEEAYNQFVQSLPEVQQANQTMQAAKEAERQAQAQQAKAILDEEIAKISSQDSSIRTVEDLMECENYDQIYGMVKHGYRLSDAFKLVNFDRLTQKAVDASRQQVRNQTLGKSHMSQTHARGTGAVEVPREIKQMYLELNPKATDAEIRSNYAQYLKSNERRN